MRITHGGGSSHLRNEAAENHLQQRIMGDESASFALRAIENSRLDTKFKLFLNDLERDRSFLRFQSDDSKIELYAIFQ